MLTTFAASVYIALSYVLFGFKLADSQPRPPKRLAIFLWLFSPVSYPTTLLIEWLVEEPI